VAEVLFAREQHQLDALVQRRRRREQERLEGAVGLLELAQGGARLRRRQVGVEEEVRRPELAPPRGGRRVGAAGGQREQEQRGAHPLHFNTCKMRPAPAYHEERQLPCEVRMLIPLSLALAAVTAPITDVTVYSDRARVVRTADVKVAGVQKIE